VVSAGALFRAALQRRRKVLMTTETIPSRADSHKPGDNAPRRFTPADAPPATSNRALRRLWAAEANRGLYRTGDLDEARRTRAEMLIAALDCDAAIYRHHRQTRACAVPVNLPAAANDRGHNCDGTRDRAVAAILAGERP
jgi:hypothetical protein